MNSREAKDFLVQQAAQQAALDNVPFSDLERRMMYFTESGDCPEDPTELNHAFEAQYKMDEYEAKVSKLLHRAYRPISKEDAEAAREWNDAIRILREGDHYILVLWEQGPKERPSHDSLRLLFAGLLLAGIVTSVMLLRPHHEIISWKRGPNTTSSVPQWLQRPLLLALVLGVGRSLVWLLGTKREN